MGLNKLQKDNMNYRLAQRLTLMEEIEGYLANAGRLVRQVEQMDRKFLESFADDGIAFPDCFTATGFKEMFDQELAFQIEQGEHPRGTFMAMVAPARISMADQFKQIHDQLLAGDFQKERD